MMECVMVVFKRALILLVGCLLSTAGVAQGQGGPPPANVVLDQVRVERLEQRRVATGEIRSRLSSQLASQVEGLLVEMNVEEGDVVQAGEVLAKLDDERAKIAVDRARADVDFAQAVVKQRAAELANAKRDLARLEELDQLGSSGVSQLDEARTLVASRDAISAQVKASLISAQGELRMRERELADMTIMAPFAGQVLHKSGSVGQWVGRGDVVATVVSLDKLEAWVDIPEDVFAAVARSKNRDEPVEISLSAVKERVYGQIAAILPQADSLSRLFAVRIAVSAKDKDGNNLLRPGMSLSAWVPTGKPGDFVTVSKDAIVRTSTGEVVYWDNDGKSAIAPVTRLFAAGDRVAVQSPVLHDGMMVVVSGNERMFPGQPLNIQDGATHNVVGSNPATGRGD